MNTQYKTNIIKGAMQGFMNGISQASDAVKPTMGAAGTNVVIACGQYPYHQITNDGATIIENIYLEDPVEALGLEFAKEVVGRSNKNAGDGSTTTVVLLEAILREGLKQEVKGIELKRQLDACLPLIEEAIDAQKKLITSDDYERLKQVATISCEDEKVGELLAEIYQKIGKDGIIHPEYTLGKEENYYDFIQGVRFANGTGYLSPAMVHDEEALKEKRKETRAVYENPTILVTKRKIASVRDINRILQSVGQKQGDLVIFTDDMDSQVASFMIATHQERKRNPVATLPRITIIKAPVLWKNYVFEDFAKCVGATILEDSTGVNFKNLDASHLGTCEKIIIDKEETILIGTKDLREHIQELNNIVGNGDYGDNDCARRISWLTTKTVLLKVGGLSETELTYKRLKIEDAIWSTRSALQDGIVAGGGICLSKVSLDLSETTTGGKILKEALLAPVKQIIENTNSDYSVLKDIVMDGIVGFDAKSKTIVNMFDVGIVDSAKIVKNAVKNAVGIASTLLTASTCLILPPKDTSEALKSLLAPQQFPFQ